MTYTNDLSIIFHSNKGISKNYLHIRANSCHSWFIKTKNRLFRDAYKLFAVLLAIVCIIFLSSVASRADNGYRLWLKYDKIENTGYLSRCQKIITSFRVAGSSSTIAAAKEELKAGLDGLLGTAMPMNNQNGLVPGIVLAGTPVTAGIFKQRSFANDLSRLKKGGYIIREVRRHSGSCIVIAANEDIGVLYGIFHFLRLLQTHTSLKGLNISSSPKIQWRILDHWDNLDGSVERGYAGKSLWKWNELPEKIDSRYKDYARANASIGINGVVLNNVNSDPNILSKAYLVKVAALANVFRPYGIHVFLSANFASPKVLGKLNTADPLNPAVIEWWKNKADEIYKLIPDFGGFLVKANSEGQPGPRDYNRTHVQGANMMADALAPHGGILIWRAFVYAMRKDEDRAKMAYDEFAGFEGKFHANVFLQIKNGPIDFQPREPFSPLFGAMPHTNEMMEFQITQEYLGHSKALVYLAPLFKETLESDTYANGKGSTVANILDGSLQGQHITGMAGVANIGDDSDWTGYIFGQPNWYAFGRLAWNHELSAKEIAAEWIKMTLTNETDAVETILKIMLGSREALMNYETPLGLSVLCGWDHYGPAPQIREYYHRADTLGLGFDRTSGGSDAVGQYFLPVRNSFNHIHTCPEKFLAWFHHVPWNYTMKSGRTFWEELCYKYYTGVKSVEQMQRAWSSLQGKIDQDIFISTNKLLITQEEAARKWRNVCLTYFERFSKQPVPSRYKLSM